MSLNPLLAGVDLGTTNIKAIVCFSQSGTTVSLVARERPWVPIIALTQIITVSFTRRTDTPTCSAYSSPMLMALSARACEACGQPVRSAAQEPTVMVQRPAVEKPEMPPELKEALEPSAPPPSPAEQTMPAYTPPPAPEPAKLRDIHQYPVVQPKPPQKNRRTTRGTKSWARPV